MGGKTGRFCSPELIGVVPPQHDRFIELPIEAIELKRDYRHDSVYGIGIIFTDAAGNRWERDPYGGLNSIAS
jgi:hypothetical protein